MEKLNTKLIRISKNQTIMNKTNGLKFTIRFNIIKNVSSSTSHKKLRLSECLYENLRKFFLTHLFMNRF